MIVGWDSIGPYTLHLTFLRFHILKQGGSGVKVFKEIVYIILILYILFL